MHPITIIAFPTAPAGHENELAARLDTLASATRAEPGCLSFTVHQHPQTPSRFAVYEKFRDQAAFDVHLQYEHAQVFVEWLQASGSTLQFERWDERR
ncbi:MAG: hypothetical protein GAK30_02540 [Paracidovorax wautersii]|uniref:ABM domain-containing protein n=1 Tax=Paracidovorax wautersii TaxID=1177982 RepID=A0A7V8JQ05_9BURK|nr:MAG: hypothetical protein GAK30_02540 [Paracidovorax wautersii]